MKTASDRCKFPARALSLIRERGLCDATRPTLAAVSGGPDSVCLLHVLLEAGYPIEVAHFDHQTRAGGSAADAVFVREVAERLGIPFHIETRPVEAEARECGLSFEEYARRVRYEFLVGTARARGCAAVATGHHAGDQAETVLMRVLRGTTTAGLGGIPPVREQDGVRIVRPFLTSTRDEIVDYLRERGLAYRVDSTNADLRFVRNRVRHELLPMLEREYNPEVREALSRLAAAARVDEAFLDAMAATELEECLEDGAMDRARFAALPPAIQSRAILRMARRAGVDLPFDRVWGAAAFVCGAPAGRKFDLGNGIFLANARTKTEVLGALPDQCGAGIPACGFGDEEIALSAPGTTCAFGAVFTIASLDGAVNVPWSRYCTPSRQVFDADALGQRVAVRRRRPGDRFTPYGMTGSKKLKDYFTDIGIPGWRRDEQLVLTGDDRIAWVVGHAVSAHAVLTPDTRRIVEIEVRREGVS